MELRIYSYPRRKYEISSYTSSYVWSGNVKEKSKQKKLNITRRKKISREENRKQMYKIRNSTYSQNLKTKPIQSR